MSDITATAFLGVPNFDMYVKSAFDSIEFRGKTLEEWEYIVDLPDLKEGLDSKQLLQYNQVFIDCSRIIMNNLSYAKSSLKACEMHHESEVLSAKINITNELREKNPGGRLPSIDNINSMAENKCIESLIAKNIAEIFLNFWQSQYDKIKIIDSRLSGIGYLFGLEAKASMYKDF